MLLPMYFLADLIAIYPVVGVIPLVFLFFISLNCKLADVIAFYVEDRKPHFIYLNCWQMLLPWWQMEWPPRVGGVWQML